MGRIRKQKRPLHDYPKGWKHGDWLVPYIDDHACIYHSHEDADNHSLCGPQIFCCRGAVDMLLQRYPNFLKKNMTWSLTEANHLLSWGVPWFYIFFCDPSSARRLRFVGISQEDQRLVLQQQRPLSYYLPVAGLVVC